MRPLAATSDTSVVLVFLILIVLAIVAAPHVFSYDETNVSTTVNVTNSKPTVLNVEIQDDGDITLQEGTTQTVWCNVSIRDFNGYDDIENVNATFWDPLNTTEGNLTLDNNSKYVNTSCAFMSGNGYFANYTCTFEVLYYANNGTWNCNVSVNDSYNFNANGSNTTIVQPLYAFNMSDLIDYGNMAVEETSSNIDFNITNWGNQRINVSVWGFGNETTDGLAMVCEVGNITIANERYSVDSGSTWATMDPLTGSAVQVPGLTIDKQINTTEILNSTYWSLYIPPNPFGRCNGTVVIEALSSI